MSGVLQILVVLIVGVLLGGGAVVLLARRRQAFPYDIFVQAQLDDSAAVVAFLAESTAFARIVVVGREGPTEVLASSSNDPYPQLVLADICKGALDAMVQSSSTRSRVLHICSAECEDRADSQEWWIALPVLDVLGTTICRIVYCLIGVGGKLPTSSPNDATVAAVSRSTKNIAAAISVGQRLGFQPHSEKKRWRLS